MAYINFEDTSIVLIRNKLEISKCSACILLLFIYDILHARILDIDFPYSVHCRTSPQMFLFIRERALLNPLFHSDGLAEMFIYLYSYLEVFKSIVSTRVN